MEERPAIDYLSKDFASFRQVMLDRLSATLPQWEERHLPDLGMTLVDLLAYVGDYLSYYQDAVATEAYLGTARQRISVRRHARLLDYVLHEGCNARTWVHVEVQGEVDSAFLEPNEVKFVASDDATPPTPAALIGAELSASPLTNHAIFEPVSDATIALRKAHNRMRVVGRLEAGTTHAVMRVNRPPEPGEVLILVPHPTRRREQVPDAHPVTLLRAYAHGPSRCTVVWHDDDALPGRLADRRLVALGNNVLVGHGETICEQAVVKEGRLPPLSWSGLSHSVPLPRHELQSAARTLAQDPREALANLRLDGGAWEIRSDLLQSLPSERHFCVEIDDRGRAHVRFGGNGCGARPADNSAFLVRYRVGNGRAGHVAAGAISSVVFTGYNAPPNIKVHNPLPATGGIEPESAASVRLVAPGYMRVHQQRAISPEDYANFAHEIDGVQQAAAVIVGEGARRVVRVALDPIGYLARHSKPTDWKNWQRLARRVANRLEAVRRINHDVVVVPPTYVDLRVVLGLEVFPGHLRAEVEGQVRRVLFGFQPDVQQKPTQTIIPETGANPMFHPGNQTFGEPVYWSRIVSAIHKVPGVARVEQIEFGRTDRPIATMASPPARNIDVGPQEIAVLAQEDDYFVIKPIEAPRSR